MGDVQEKGLGPELHGDAGDDDHWCSRNKKAGRGQLGLGLSAKANYSSLAFRISSPPPKPRRPLDK
jgi:hypothetical protein